MVRDVVSGAASGMYVRRTHLTFWRPYAEQHASIAGMVALTRYIRGVSFHGGKLDYRVVLMDDKRTQFPGGYFDFVNRPNNGRSRFVVG